MNLVRRFFGITGLVFVAGVGTAAEFFVGGRSHLAVGQRTTLADLAEPATASAQVTEPAMAAEAETDEPVALAAVHTKEPAAAPRGKPASPLAESSDELATLREEKRALQLQQEYLLEQVVKYKRQLLSAQGDGEPRSASTGPVDRKDPVAVELEKERIRGRDLERQIEQLKQHGTAIAHDREEYESIKQRLSDADDEVKRLTAALEGQRGTSNDNSFLRKDLATAKARVAELEKQAVDGRAGEKKIRDLETEVEALTERTKKDDADLKKVADFAIGLKKELQEQKALVQARDGQLSELKNELQKSNVRLTDQMSAEAELGKLRTAQSALTEQLSEERKRRVELEQALGSAREAIQKAQTERDALQSDVTQGQQASAGAQEELDETKRQLSKVIEDMRTCQQGSQQKDQQVSRVGELESTLRDAKGELSKKQQQLDTCDSKSHDQEELLTKLPELRRELVAAKNQLLMKDQEIQLLSKKGGSVPAAAGANAAANTAPASAAPRAAMSNEVIDRHMEESGRRAGVETIRGKKTDPVADAMIVEIIVPRAALRSGPSPDDSEVMSLGQGSRLTVEERTRDWYRVIAPNSTRAYVRADLVRAITGDASGAAGVEQLQVNRAQPAAHAPRKRPLQVGGTNADMVPFGDVKGAPSTTAQDSIDRAFEKIRKGVGSKPVTPEMIPNQGDATE